MNNYLLTQIQSSFKIIDTTLYHFKPSFEKDPYILRVSVDSSLDTRVQKF